ncbi:MAG: zinc-ribbon domain-containing protein [Anaerolineaceae bacterium]|nr:zinc-ribbon domain-containing protein [Anaerolineaceae bacterium]
MDIGAIFLILTLALLVGLYVGRPIFQSTSKAVKALEPDLELQDHRRSTLLAERDRLLTALQELDFDNALGKIPEEDYPVQRAELLAQAAMALRELDELQGGQADAATEDRIEQAVAARRADAIASRAPARDADELEAMIASRRKERQEKSAGFCPKCGRPVSKSDKFCARCGATL